MTQLDESVTTQGAAPPAGRRRVARRATPAAGLAALALLLLAACSGGGSNNGASTAGKPVADTAGGAFSTATKAAAPPAAQPAAGQAAGAGKTDGTGQTAAQPEARIAPDQALIRRADLTVRVRDVNAKANDLVRIAADNDGLIYSDNRSGSGDTATAEIVLKVAPDRLDATLARISGLGKEVGRTSSTEDVTQEVADVDSRVASMKASIGRVRAILARATSIGDVVNVEGELSRREAELESLQARQRTLAGQVALSTVTAHLLAEAAPAPPPPAAATSDSGFLTGLKNGWKAFAGTVNGLLTVIGAILPFLLIALPLLAGWRYLQRQRRGTIATPAAAPEPPAV
ncbi:MAG: hypothetical protein V7637_261 [Mycobacteriales bacterium]